MHPVKRSDDFAYFEMTVLDGGESNIIALGFVPEGYKLHDFPVLIVVMSKPVLNYW